MVRKLAVHAQKMDVDIQELDIELEAIRQFVGMTPASPPASATLPSPSPPLPPPLPPSPGPLPPSPSLPSPSPCPPPTSPTPLPPLPSPSPSPLPPPPWDEPPPLRAAQRGEVQEVAKWLREGGQVDALRQSITSGSRPANFSLLHVAAGFGRGFVSGTTGAARSHSPRGAPAAKPTAT